MSIFDDATKFAVDAHSGMMRKGAELPYILHPLEVSVIAGTMTDNPEVLAAAVLHDTVEDTNVTMEDIKNRFGDRVAELVESETENKYREIPPDVSWRTRKEESLEKLRNSNDIDVKKLWLADKLSNMRSFYDMWQKDGHDLWKHFNQKDPVQQAWYYRSIDELLSVLKEYKAWQEYHILVEMIFRQVPSF